MKEQNLLSYYLPKEKVLKISIRILPELKYLLPVLFLAACTGMPKDDGVTPAPLFPQAQTIEVNPPGGYAVNHVSGDSIQPIINFEGDTLKTGVPISVKGKVIHPDSVNKPNSVPIPPKGQLIKKPVHHNHYKIPDNLIVMPVDESKLTYIRVPQVVEADTSHYIINSIGASIPTGRPIPAKGKAVPAIQPEPVAALLPQMKDAAITNLQYLDVEQGMASSTVWSIVEDRIGNLWFGTEGGVSKYDGVEFTHYTEKEGLSNNTIYSIVEDRSGNLWFGTWGGGVSKYDGVGFTHYTDKEGLSNNRVLSIIEDRIGNLWFGTEGGVSKFDGEEFTHYTEKEGLSSNLVWSIVEDRSGNLWFGTESGVSKFDGEGFTHYTEKEGLSNNRVLSIVEDRSGNLWFGTNGGGVSKFDGEGFTHYTEKEGLSNNRVFSIVEDRIGNLWFGTWDGGVNKFDGEGFTHYTEKEGLSNNRVSSIVEDRIGNLWFGTWVGGVSKYDGEGFIHYTENEGLSNNTVWSIVEDRSENLWFGTDGGGVSKYDGEGFTHYSENEGLSNNTVSSIVEDRIGNLWFGTLGGGVSKFDGEGFTHYSENEGLSGNVVLSIVEDRIGNLWIGTYGGGVSKFDGEGFTHYTEKEGLSSNLVRTIIEDRSGNLWFGTDGGGVSKYDGEGFTHYTEKEGLSSNLVRTIVEDRIGNLWIGTYGGGVSKFDGERFTHYTEKEGLSSNIVWSIVEDTNATNDIKIYMGTDKGITKLIIPSITTSEEENSSLQVFVKHDGLKGLDALNNSAVIDSKNRAWWGMGKSLTMLDLNKNQPAKIPPAVYLRQLAINEQFIDFHNFPDRLGNEIKFKRVQPFENYPLLLELPYDKNHITFHFSAIDWSAPHKILYSYRMLGLYNRWSTPAPESKADYRNLPYGTFIFQIRAIGESGEWSKAFEYNFTIRPPWWHTWWAYALYALLFIAVIVAVDRFQRRRLIAKERERARERELEQQKAHSRQLEKAYSELEDSLKKLTAAQDQLVQQEKLASLGQLTAGIAHEIKNPLNFVNNFSEVSVEMVEEAREELLSEKAKGKSEKVKEALAILDDIEANLRKIHEHGSRADSIVKSMLQHSRGGDGLMEPTPLNPLIKEYVNLAYHGMRAGKDPINVEIELDLSEDVEEINLIAEDFSRVILNLCNNAFDAMREKLSAVSDQPSAYQPKLKVRTFLKEKIVSIEIEDNGTGIPEEIKDKILQPFFTTKKGTAGTGLGMSITNDIVNAHGGEILIESSQGEGSKFTIRLNNK